MNFGFTSEGVIISLSAVADGSSLLASAVADQFGFLFSRSFRLMFWFSSLFGLWTFGKFSSAWVALLLDMMFSLMLEVIPCIIKLIAAF